MRASRCAGATRPPGSPRRRPSCWIGLAQAAGVEDLPARLPEARRILRRKLADLHAGRVPRPGWWCATA